MTCRSFGALLAAVGVLVFGGRLYAQGTAGLHAVEQALVAQGADRVGGYRSDQVIVRFRDGVLGRGIAAAADETGQPRVWDVAPPRELSPAFRLEWQRFGVRRMQRLYPFAFGDGEAAVATGLSRTLLIELPPGTDTPGFVAALRRLPGEIESVELDAIGEVAEFIPNDPNFWRQYNMRNPGGPTSCAAVSNGVPDADIDATDAWALFNGIGGGEVVVAVIDSGVDPHPEFQDRMLPGINLAQPGIPTSDTSDDCQFGHGTHVTGILTATGNNGVGVAGVNWGAKVLPIRVMGTSNACGGTIAAAVAAIMWAADNGAHLINMSVQYPINVPDTASLENAVNYATLRGVLVVAAAGNNDYCGTTGAVCAPARFANALAVSATTNVDRFATTRSNQTRTASWSSNFGPEVDVCAPGDGIYSTAVWSPTYYCASGTSMATPQVTGLAALMKSYVPGLTISQLRSAIQSTAEDLTWNPQVSIGVPAGEPLLVGTDSYYGHGRINAYRALLAVGEFRIVGSDPPDGAIDARQPHAPDGSNPAGWNGVHLLFAGDREGFAAATAEEFEAVEESATSAALFVSTIIPDEEASTVTVVLNRALTPGTWVRIRHVPSDSSVRVGFLPGDVNGDGASAPPDILALVDSINGVTPRPVWATDVDRSGATGPEDILRVIDLLNGAGTYDPWLHVSLP